MHTRQFETGQKRHFLTHAHEDGDEVELVGHGASSSSSSSTLGLSFYKTSQRMDLDMPAWDYDDVITRSSDLCNSGVASWSQEDPDVQKDGSDDSLSDFDIVSSTGLPNPSVRRISSHLSVLQNRMKESRPFKYGTCDAAMV